jgi:hypothetical protein
LKTVTFDCVNGEIGAQFRLKWPEYDVDMYMRVYMSIRDAQAHGIASGAVTAGKNGKICLGGFNDDILLHEFS